MSNLPFVEVILADLRRFNECVEDGQDVNLGRDRFDLLTQLGLLRRVQRSPALWEMTSAGEEAITQAEAPGVMPPEISHHLLGKIVDEVFESGIEDATVIADIYRVIARECRSSATELANVDGPARAVLQTATLAATEPVEIEVPTFQPEGMGCGLEDRGITDRYEAMEYGYNEALEQQWQIINCHGPLFTVRPAPVYSAAGEPLAWMTKPLRGSNAGKLCLCDPFETRDPELWASPFPVFATQPAAGEPIQVEAVAITREDEDGLYLDWVLEGGISALEAPGVLLLAAHGTVTGDQGSGEVYLAPPAASGEPVKSSDELAAFEKWRHTQADSLRRCGYPDGADAFIRLGSVQWAGWQARARLTAPPAAAHGDGLHFKTLEELATAIRQVSAYEDLGPELIAEEMFKQAGSGEAAHGDEAVRSRLCDAYERGYQDGQKWPDSYSLQADKDKVADELLAAMRAQGDEAPS